ncbi:hypothetical protein CEXT_44351 [Caerostris extrusa]|uniref:Uncharacterized protein n=1 Tax=Caerostris extrusa TaxID=172846 RepID=A0AAV4Q9G9_CAEEX|nr:hypothetical protein CEXT_44351 [Caerostris extrusa]
MHFIFFYLHCAGPTENCNDTFQEFSERRPRKISVFRFFPFSTPITSVELHWPFLPLKGRVSRSFRTKYCRGEGGMPEITVSGKVTFRILLPTTDAMALSYLGMEERF